MIEFKIGKCLVFIIGPMHRRLFVNSVNTRGKIELKPTQPSLVANIMRGKANNAGDLYLSL